MTIKHFLPIAVIFAIVSCRPTIRSSTILDKMKINDTLRLFAEYSECGEWGGHIEQIIVIRKQEDLKAVFYRDTVDCHAGRTLGRTLVTTKIKPIDIEARNSIACYIDTFLLATKFNETPDMNASNVFKLILKDTTYEYINWKFNWTEFNTLRNDLFYKNEEDANR